MGGIGTLKGGKKSRCPVIPIRCAMHCGASVSQHGGKRNRRRLRRLRQHELGNAPAVIYLAGCYGVFALEELLRLLGTPVCESLLPAIKQTSSPNAAT